MGKNIEEILDENFQAAEEESNKVLDEVKEQSEKEEVIISGDKVGSVEDILGIPTQPIGPQEEVKDINEVLKEEKPVEENPETTTEETSNETQAEEKSKETTETTTEETQDFKVSEDSILKDVKVSVGNIKETTQAEENNSELGKGYREFFTAETVPVETSNENLSEESKEGLQDEIDCNKLAEKPIDECVENLYSKTLRESREFAKSIGKSEVFETIVDCINKSHKFSYYHCGRLIRNGISIEKLKQFYNEFKTYGIQNKTEDILLKALDEFISAIPENTEK
jgi:hypothetical protein|nr:MAG TPA: hypothetical protein [Caudoviricetes sp.]